jgi:HAE1 family hydrophobic/amphiphilic exporter-1
MWALAHKLSTLAMALAIFIGSVFMVPLLGTEFVPKSDFSETNLTFHTPVGSSLEVTEARARQVDALIRSFPEVRYTLTTINTGNAAGKMYASIYIRLVDRKQRSRSVDDMSVLLRQKLREVPGITVTHVGLLDPVGGQKQISFSIQGADMGELSRLTAVAGKIRPIAGLVDMDSSLKPDKPTLDVAGAPRCGLRPGTERGADRCLAAHPGCWANRGQLARTRRPDLRCQCALAPRSAQPDR